MIAPPPSVPAIAAKPPSGPVIARPPAHATSAPLSTEARATAPPTSAPVFVKPAAHEAPAASAPPTPPVSVKAEPIAASATELPAASAGAPQTEFQDAGESARSVATPAPRRVIMPQTGPRPVYSAPPVAPPNPASAPTPLAGPQAGGPASGSGVIQRGQPIFQRNRPGGSPGFGQRPQQGAQPYNAGAPGAPARRPMHPTRSSPTGGPPGSRPPMGGGRPGFPPRPGFGPRPGGPGGAVA